MRESHHRCALALAMIALPTHGDKQKEGRASRLDDFPGHEICQDLWGVADTFGFLGGDGGVAWRRKSFISHASFSRSIATLGEHPLG